MARIRKKSAVPVYSIAALWMFWASCMPMYRVSNYIWLGIWSVIIYKFTGLFWRGKWEEIADPEPLYQSTGNPELDELVVQKNVAIQKMRELNGKIRDEKLSGQIDHMEELTDNIFKQVAKNPKDVSQIRKFMNYYLPTALKLLEYYAELSTQGVRGKNITVSMTKIEGIMDTIIEAFEKQLDSLFGTAALDISTDITVLEGMLQREGLTKQQMMTR